MIYEIPGRNITQDILDMEFMFEYGIWRKKVISNFWKADSRLKAKFF